MFAAVIGMALIGAMLFAGVGQGSGARDQQQIVIGYAGNLTLPILAEAQAAAIAEAKRLGVKLLLAPSNDAQTQEAAVRNLIAKNPDAISIDPWDSYAISPIIKEANARNIPVITWIGTPLAGGKVETFIAADELKGSIAVSKYIFKRMGGTGEVGYVQGDKAHIAGAAREKGFRQALKQYPNIKLTGYGVGGWVPDKTRDLTLNMLTANPNIKAILTNYDGMSIGAASAAKTLNKKILIAGVDGECPMLSGIWKGEQTATFDQLWEYISALSISSAVKVVKGGTLPKRIVTPSFTIDRAAMKQIKAGKYKAPKDALFHLKRQVNRAIRGCK